MVDRKTQLNQWLNSVIARENSDVSGLVTVSGDASFRRYFRLETASGSRIAVDAPPDKENNPEFVALARMLAGNEINVPVVYAEDYAQGFMLLSDLGDELFYSGLESEEKADALYVSAIENLVKMQQASHASCSLPSYDAELILRELAIFPEWFVAGLLKIDNYPEFDALSDVLIGNFLTQPQVFVHRDYHSRNLMIVPGQPLGVIDFQDAVIGPVSYDLASLLKDCYIKWPEHVTDRWVALYIEQARAAKLLPEDISATEFMRWFDLLAMQRHLKCAGIFSRLYLRDAKPGYLSDIPLVMEYILATCSKYPELNAFHQWLQATVMPAMAGLDGLLLANNSGGQA